METFKLDDRVKVIGKNVKGRIAFIGKTHVSAGIMYGIALDKPKGRCSGTVGGVRYFMCPKDHGVFVRACQLEIDSGNSTDDSDHYKDVVPRPTYPNYLKYSSKINFKKSKHHSKSKELVPKIKSPVKRDAQKKQTPEVNCLQNTSQEKLTSDPRPKVKKTRQSPGKRAENRVSVDEKFRFLSEKNNMQSQQLYSIHRYLKKLKTYLRWSRGFDSKENQMKNLLDRAIDSVIRNMEEITGNNEIGNDCDQCKGDTGLEKENTLLLQCIWDLEKKNETLVDCMTKIRAILLNSWRPRSLDKLKSDINRKETSGRSNPSVYKCNNCSTKNSETRSVPNLSTKEQQLFNENFQKSGQGKCKTETIKKYLESLNYGNKNENQEKSLLSKVESRLNDNSKGDSKELRKAACVRNYLESLNHDIKELNKELNDMRSDKSNDKCDEKVQSKSNLLQENIKSSVLKESQKNISYKIRQPPRSPKDNNRYKPYALVKRLKPEQNDVIENIDTIEDDKNPTKELFELISNIMTKITLNEQNKMAPKDSPKLREQSINLSETYEIVSKCHSNPDSDKCEMVSNSSNKSKSEDNLKLSKSMLSANMKRRKSPKKRIHLKQTIDVKKKPTSHRAEKKD